MGERIWVKKNNKAVRKQQQIYAGKMTARGVWSIEQEK